LLLNITYRLEANITLRWEVHDIPVKVSRYPELSLSVIDASGVNC